MVSRSNSKPPLKKPSNLYQSKRSIPNKIQGKNSSNKVQLSKILFCTLSVGAAIGSALWMRSSVSSNPQRNPFKDAKQIISSHNLSSSVLGGVFNELPFHAENISENETFNHQSLVHQRVESFFIKCWPLMLNSFNDSITNLSTPENLSRPAALNMLLKTIFTYEVGSVFIGTRAMTTLAYSSTIHSKLLDIMSLGLKDHLNIKLEPLPPGQILALRVFNLDLVTEIFEKFGEIYNPSKTFEEHLDQINPYKKEFIQGACYGIPLKDVAHYTSSSAYSQVSLANSSSKTLIISPEIIGSAVDFKKLTELFTTFFDLHRDVIDEWNTANNQNSSENKVAKSVLNGIWGKFPSIAAYILPAALFHSESTCPEVKSKLMHLLEKHFEDHGQAELLTKNLVVLREKVALFETIDQNEFDVLIPPSFLAIPDNTSDRPLARRCFPPPCDLSSHAEWEKLLNHFLDKAFLNEVA